MEIEEESFYIKVDSFQNDNQDQSILEEQHFGQRNKAISSFDVDIDELIEKAFQEEEAQRIQNTTARLEEKKLENETKRPRSYIKKHNGVKFEIMQHLNDLLSLTKEEKKQKKLKIGETLQKISNNHSIPIKTLWTWYY